MNDQKQEQERMQQCPICKDDYPYDADGTEDIWEFVGDEFLCDINGEFYSICRGCSESIDNHGSTFVYTTKDAKYKTMFDGSIFKDYGYFDDEHDMMIGEEVHDILKQFMKTTETHIQFMRGATITESTDKFKEVFYIASVYCHKQEERFIESMRTAFKGMDTPFVQIYNKTTNVMSTVLQFFCRTEDYDEAIDLAEKLKNSYNATEINLR